VARRVEVRVRALHRSVIRANDADATSPRCSRSERRTRSSFEEAEDL